LQQRHVIGVTCLLGLASSCHCKTVPNFERLCLIMPDKHSQKMFHLWLIIALSMSHDFADYRLQRSYFLKVHFYNRLMEVFTDISFVRMQYFN